MLPNAPPTTASIQTSLTAARAEYRKALAFHQEMVKLREVLGPGNPDGTQALHNASRELSYAAGRYEDALRDFMRFSDQHRPFAQPGKKRRSFFGSSEAWT
jgi:hypothetical protein